MRVPVGVRRVLVGLVLTVALLVPLTAHAGYDAQQWTMRSYRKVSSTKYMAHFHIYAEYVPTKQRSVTFNSKSKYFWESHRSDGTVLARKSVTRKTFWTRVKKTKNRNFFVDAKKVNGKWVIRRIIGNALAG